MVLTLILKALEIELVLYGVPLGDSEELKGCAPLLEISKFTTITHICYTIYREP